MQVKEFKDQALQTVGNISFFDRIKVSISGILLSALFIIFPKDAAKAVLNTYLKE